MNQDALFGGQVFVQFADDVFRNALFGVAQVVGLQNESLFDFLLDDADILFVLDLHILYWLQVITGLRDVYSVAGRENI